MRLIRPRVFDISNRFSGTVPQTFEHTDSFTGLKLTREASVLFLSEELSNTNEFVNLELNTNLLTKEQLDNYVAMQNLILASASSAEDIKSRFLEVNIQILESSADRPTQPHELKSKRNELMKSDFMILKDRFMAHLKQDTLIKRIDEYSSNGKLKDFRRDLDAFVIDRNIYTHGRLLYLNPSYEFVVQYIDNLTKQVSYAFITHEVKISYNNFYKRILKLLEAYRLTRKESNGDGGKMWAMLRFPSTYSS